jgi:hypothetical protein
VRATGFFGASPWPVPAAAEVVSDPDGAEGPSVPDRAGDDDSEDPPSEVGSPCTGGSVLLMVSSFGEYLLSHSKVPVDAVSFLFIPWEDDNLQPIFS